jgi:hypothetical protein
MYGDSSPKAFTVYLRIAYQHRRADAVVGCRQKRVWDCDEPVSLMVPVPLD